jgi:hypothetical protein
MFSNRESLCKSVSVKNDPLRTSVSTCVQLIVSSLAHSRIAQKRLTSLSHGLLGRYRNDSGVLLRRLMLKFLTESLLPAELQFFLTRRRRDKYTPSVSTGEQNCNVVATLHGQRHYSDGLHHLGCAQDNDVLCRPSAHYQTGCHDQNRAVFHGAIIL